MSFLTQQPAKLPKYTRRPRSTFRALLIGIRYFNTENELNGCHQDIDDVTEHITKKYPKYDITTLKDKFEDSIFQDKYCPTYANIVQHMKQLVTSSKSNDTLLVYYSGHGSNQADSNPTNTTTDETDGTDESICPVDCTTSGMLTDDIMYQILVEGLPEGVKLRVVFDSCHSGSALDLPLRWTGYNFIEEGSLLKKDIIFISGCRDPETSADADFKGHPNGALTNALLQALEHISQLPTTVHTWRMLGISIQTNLRNAGFDQVPQISVCDQSAIDAQIDI